jgi:S-disulfanyl-L-cysteine oxidoreductase SoxD
MSRFSELLLSAVLLCGSPGAAEAAGHFPNLGRTATPDEVKAWDIDVRPDFKGLPPGSGTVAHGADVWEAKCASCHGTFGESNEVFTPLVGGTTKEDIETGRVGAYIRGDAPQRTTLMKVATVSTLWDYINRAMPWNAPKSLTHDEVYAVLAYILNLGDIVPADFTLSDKNIADVQKRLPNRNGMTTKHGLWDIKGKPDTKNVACMKNCTSHVTLASSLPEYARDAHGDLAEQNRKVGAVRGQHTGGDGDAVATVNPGVALMKSQGCSGCHGIGNGIVGPAFRDVAKRYKNDKDAESGLARKLRRKWMNTQRRQALKSGGALGLFGVLVAAGLVTAEEARAAGWDKPAFDAKTMDDALKALGAGKPGESSDIMLNAPDIAENGAVVPVGVKSSLPGTEFIAILIEKNPSMLAASFTLPDGTPGDISTRVKMGQTSSVYALVKADGKYFMVSKEIKVTLGGCGG